MADKQAPAQGFGKCPVCRKEIQRKDLARASVPGRNQQGKMKLDMVNVHKKCKPKLQKALS